MGNKSDMTFEEPEEKDASTSKTAPVLLSTRLLLFVSFFLCVINFLIQRFNINFAVVCMHTPRSPYEDSLTLNHTQHISIPTHDHHLLDDLGLASLETEYDDVLITETTTTLPKSSDGCPEGPMKKVNDTKQFEERSHLYEFDWSKETQSNIIAAFYYGHTFAQIPGGWLVDRFGCKVVMIWSQLLLSILTILNPMAAKLGPQVIFVLRMFQGVANGATMPAINVLAIRWCGTLERSLLLGIAYAGFGLGTAIVYPVCAFLCENMGWEWTFYAPGGTGILWCVSAMFLIFEWPENHPRIGKEELNFLQKNRAVHYGGEKRQVVKTPWLKMLLSTAVWAHVVTNFCCFFCFLTIGAYLPTYLSEVLHLDISNNGLLSALPFVGMMSVHFSIAVLFDFLRKKNFCSVIVLRKSFNTIGMTMSAVSMILLGFVPCNSLIANIILFTLSQTLLELAWMGGYLFSIFEIAPKYAAGVTSITNTVAFMAGFLSPAMVSWMTQDGTRDQWLHVYYTSAAINIFGMLFYLVFGTSTLQPWAAEPDEKNGARNGKDVEGQELKLLGASKINGKNGDKLGNANGEDDHL